MHTSFDESDIETLAKAVEERLKPLFNRHGKDSADEGFLSKEQAADFLGVKPSWLYNNAESESIPKYKIGGLKFKKSDLLKWAETRKARTS